MNRTKINLAIDAVSFVAFLFLVTTGVLLHFLLPPGSGHWTTVWTLDRHEWGEIHFWIALTLFASLGAHVALHWKWIVCVLKGRQAEGSGTRLALGTLGLTALIALAATPLLAPLDQGDAGAGRGRAAEHDQERIPGSMTLGQVEARTGVSDDVLVRELGLPPDVSRERPLGQLAQQYGFTMTDVRRVVDRHAPVR
ncbi:MAG TPA: DUF4405 domain-containing protein [Blastocatellia bacterium]|nr:DUF4405 domain-containing protein [Blastocatellia bacterium]